LRVYIDTSVIGGCFDDEFSDESRALIDLAKFGKIILLISNILVDELTQAPEKVQRVVTDLPPDAFELLEESHESRKLRDLYIQADVVGVTHFNDAHHVAMATVSNADMIVSWNFKHIVHYEKIRQFNEVNQKAGYHEIKIFSPLEVI
jgi:predicted nucleic acid-binding protein